MRRRRGSSRGGGAFALVLLAIIGLPLTMAGYLSGPVKAPPVPTTYVSLPTTSPAPTSSIVYYGGYSPDAAGSPSSGSRGAEAPAPPAETLYVSGHKVPLRADPAAKAKILDRYNPGQAVEVLERGDGWIHVRHKLTQREGWIQARRLRDEPPSTEAEAPAPAKAKISPALGVAEIAKMLIADSIAQYPGPCACPYQSARNGSSCGRRAAYVRPGGYAPLCYAKDITSAMVAEYRASH